MTKVKVDLHQKLRMQVLNDPEARADYEAFKLQYELADRLKKQRQKAHLTQQQVAEKMATHKPVIARLEAAGGKGKHAPSLATLVKYADAVGCRLIIKLVPKKYGYRKI